MIPYFEQLPKKEEGYIIFDVYKDCILPVSSRVFLVAVKEHNVFRYYTNGYRIAKIPLAAWQPNRKEGFTLQPNEILQVELDIGCRFCEPCFFNIDLDPKLTSKFMLQSNHTIFHDSEQILVMIRSIRYITFNLKDLKFVISVPFPFQYEFIRYKECNAI